MAKKKRREEFLNGFKDTSEVSVPEKIVDQIIGQEKAVEVIKKAAEQKRNVLLVGIPGSGKSMLAQAMAELLPVQDLEDILVVENKLDENRPKVLIAKAGEGRKMVEAERLRSRVGGGNVNIILLLFLLLSSFFLLFYGRQYFGDVITAAMFIGLFISGAALLFASQLGRARLMMANGDSLKLIVDNSEGKKAPFMEATGAKAGALLGDVKHDPLQTIFCHSAVYTKREDRLVPVLLKDLVDGLFTKYPDRIERNNEGYEGMILPEEESVYVLGHKDNQTMPVRVFCVSRRAYNGRMHAVRYGLNRVIVTPEHKIYSNNEYVEAEKINGNELLKTHSLPMITREDVIKTFSTQDQKDAFNYYAFQKIKEENPSFGYKRIAEMLGIKAGQVRWWNNKKFKPKALMTVERLEKLGLLPFGIDNKIAPIAARVLGTTFGDGGVFSTLNGIFLSSSEEDSIVQYAQDLIAIFGEGIGKNFERRISGVNNTGMVVWNTNRDVIRFFVALGAPVGRKNKEFKIPAWIYLSEETQREFFGAFLGNELCSPRFSETKQQIDDFGIAIAGTYELKDNRLEILEAVSRFLNSYGIKTSSNIYEHNFRGKSFIWRLSVSKEIENISRFAHFIPIRYSKNKQDGIKKAIERTLEHKLEGYNKLIQTQKSEEYILRILRITKDALQSIGSAQEIVFDDKTIQFSGTIYNVTTESGNLFANGILVSNSGGLGTPAHLRVESGFVHRANKGVLFIDEFATLSPKSQQELLTAMQEKRYSITGQSEMSSGAMTRTEPVPCDFVLVAAGNYSDVRKIHPALRSRIRGYGYEVYMEETIEDSLENRRKVVQFIAQEVKKDGKIPHFDRDAVSEIVKEARKRAGRKNKLTLKLRDLGGLIRAAGDVAKEEKAALVSRQHVVKARKIARTLEQQMAQQIIDVRRDYQIFLTQGTQVGKVNGLALMGESGVVLPIVAEVAPSASREAGHIIATGKLGDIAKEAVENVSAIIKKHTGKDTSSYDIHIQFLQTYEGVEGDSASISVATAVISALEEVPIDQSIAMTGSLSVRGEVLPVGGVSQKIEAALEAGLKKVIIPEANEKDIVLDEAGKGKIKVITVKNIYQVLDHALTGKEKKKLLSKIKLEMR